MDPVIHVQDYGLFFPDLPLFPACEVAPDHYVLSWTKL